MKLLRLIADDLTGALDSAAQFAGPGREIPVYFWDRIPAKLPEEFAVDGATREGDFRAANAAAGLALNLETGPGWISFRKVDSLLRGSPGCELAQTLVAIRTAHCILAPAFPFHGRVTRAGLQYALREGAWERTGEDIRARLEAWGMTPTMARPGDPVPPGLSLWDAETDDDLRRIAHAGSALPGRVLWCGSGGLAAALSEPGSPPLPMSGLKGPIFGVVGSDHPVSIAQTRACDTLFVRPGSQEDASRVSAAMDSRGGCLVRFDLPLRAHRQWASSQISLGIEFLSRSIPRPRTVLAVGGETLRSMCLSLGADHLRVAGQVLPGVPVSRMVGGRWDGVEVVSKSGAFGDEALLRRLISPKE